MILGALGAFPDVSHGDKFFQVGQGDDWRVIGYNGGTQGCPASRWFHTLLEASRSFYGILGREGGGSYSRSTFLKPSCVFMSPPFLSLSLSFLSLFLFFGFGFGSVSSFHSPRRRFSSSSSLFHLSLIFVIIFVIIFFFVCFLGSFLASFFLQFSLDFTFHSPRPGRPFDSVPIRKWTRG